MNRPFDEITCPFCFNDRKYGGNGQPFSHEEVCFRISDESVEMDSSGMDTSWSAGAASLLSEETDIKEQETTFDFKQKPDDEYMKFWKGLSADIPARMNPVLKPGEYTIDENTSYAEGSGMLESALDPKGNMTTERLCPYCHNPLPKNYGQYETKFIAVVGITSCGKTVFLSQMLKKCEDLLSMSCGVSATLSLYARRFHSKLFPIRTNRPLPGFTTRGELKKELITIDLSGAQMIRPITLVLYDIAGENCIDASKMEKYGPFIRHSDAILMLLDPYQFENLLPELPPLTQQGSDDDEFAYEPSEVIITMYEAFLKSRYGGQPAKTPIALTLAKSDLLLNGSLFNEKSHIFQTIQYPTKGFRSDLHRNLSMDLKRRNVVSKALVTTAEDKFQDSDFFAVSALGLDSHIEGNVLKSDSAVPHRIEEPLLWILYKFGFIPEASPPSPPKAKRPWGRR